VYGVTVTIKIKKRMYRIWERGGNPLNLRKGEKHQGKGVATVEEKGKYLLAEGDIWTPIGDAERLKTEKNSKPFREGEKGGEGVGLGEELM